MSVQDYDPLNDLSIIARTIGRLQGLATPVVSTVPDRDTQAMRVIHVNTIGEEAMDALRRLYLAIPAGGEA